MANLKVRHLVSKTGADGAPLFYWQPATALRKAGWKGRALVDACGVPLRDAGLAASAAEAINREVDAWREAQAAGQAPKRAPKPGTVAELVRAYQRSEAWRALSDRTRADYQVHLSAIIAWAGDRPARSITPPDVQEFHKHQLGRRRVRAEGGKWQVVETPAKASAAVTVLRLLLQAGIRLGLVSSNAADKPGISYQRQRAPRLWSAEAVAAMVRAADARGLFSMGTAIMLNEWIGQREADVLALAPWSVADGALCLVQSKTGRHVALPVQLVPHLVERLQAEARRPGAVRSLAHLLPCELTGRAWNEHTFRHEFAEVRAAAACELPECAGLLFSELRHTAVTRLHEAGSDPLEIAGITGHAPKSVLRILADHYLVFTAKAAERSFRKRLAAELEAPPAAVISGAP